MRAANEAEGRDAVREIVASGSGIGFVSHKRNSVRNSRLVRIPVNAPEMLMDEALVSLDERSGGKLVRACWNLARDLSSPIEQERRRLATKN